MRRIYQGNESSFLVLKFVKLFISLGQIILQVTICEPKYDLEASTHQSRNAAHWAWDVLFLFFLRNSSGQFCSSQCPLKWPLKALVIFGEVLPFREMYPRIRIVTSVYRTNAFFSGRRFRLETWQWLAKSDACVLHVSGSQPAGCL